MYPRVSMLAPPGLSRWYLRTPNAWSQGRHCGCFKERHASLTLTQTANDQNRRLAIACRAGHLSRGGGRKAGEGRVQPCTVARGLACRLGERRCRSGTALG